MSETGVSMPGRLGTPHRVGGWPNLVEVAGHSLRHFNEICDPDYGYMAYVGGTLGFATPAFVRSRWDWVEAASYGLTGRIAARRLTGDTSGAEVEAGQRRLTLAAFHDLDGFAHRTYARGWSEDVRVILWEQARVLFTLVSWFMDTEDERLLDYIRGMVAALRRVSRMEGRHRVFQDQYWLGEEVFGAVGPVVLVEPLMKYHQLTGDSGALAFCEGIIEWITAPRTNFVDDQYRFSGWLRGLGAAVASITRYAAATDDDRLLQHCDRLFESAAGLVTGFGATPDTEPCCSTMELTTTAVALAQAGRTEYWDDVDRWFRNHTLACQFCSGHRISTGCVAGEPEPADDTRDILSRSVGGFSWATARHRLVSQQKLMLCCGGNAMWTMGKIVANAVTADAAGLTVNLHFSLETPRAAVTNCEPFEGRLEVTPRRAGRVRIRPPAYAFDIAASVDDGPAEPRLERGYLVFDDVQPDARIVLDYPLPERTTVEMTMDTPCQGNMHRKGVFGPKADPVVKERIHARWRGNTVLAIDYDEPSPEAPEHRLYLDRMERFLNGAGRSATIRCFLPDQPFDW